MASEATPLLIGLGKPLLLLLGAAAALYLLLCAWFYVTQRAHIYFPTPPVEYAHAEALWLETGGAKIKLWVVRRPGPRALLYLGGNADDAAAHVESFAATLPGHSLYLVNYRGYGGSSGRPSEPALAGDALAVFDRVRAMHEEVDVVGRSLGSGIAVRLASERPVARLVLVTPFDSLVNLAKTYFGWLPVGLLLRDRYESAALAPAVTSPVLIVIAGEDEIVPRARSDALAAAFAPGQVEVAVVRDAGHNTLDLSPGYHRSVGRFLAR